MTATTELDPVTIRHSLATQRDQGTPFDLAWKHATNHHRVTDDERSVYVFMRENFRAAYHDTPSSLGRCGMPDRDVSMAPVEAKPRVAVPSNRDRCRSGDGCDRLATRGKFGKWYCEHHGAELERLSVMLDLGIEFNPAKKQAA